MYHSNGCSAEAAFSSPFTFSPQFKRGSERVPGLYGTSFAEFGIFTGVVSVYFVVFGLLIVAAELRMASIKQTVLAHVSFLSTFIGRGAFYLLLGTLLLLPGHVASRVIGGLLLACGLCQLVVSAAVSKDALQLQEVEDDLTSIFSKPDPKERGQARTKVGAKAAQGDVESSRGTRVSRAQSGAGKAGRSTSTVETANPLGSTSAQRSSAVPSSHSGSQGRDGGAGEQQGPPPSGSADNPFLAME